MLEKLVLNIVETTGSPGARGLSDLHAAPRRTEGRDPLRRRGQLQPGGELSVRIPRLDVRHAPRVLSPPPPSDCLQKMQGVPLPG